MIIVKFCSGIGNQLYQYAFYRLMEIKYPNQQVLADISVFDDLKRLNVGNGFEYGFAIDTFFKTKITYATRKQIQKIEYEIYLPYYIRNILPVKLCQRYMGASKLKKYRNNKKNYLSNIPANAYNGRIQYLNDKENYYAGGLWQNCDYFTEIQDALREELVFKQELSAEAKKIETTIHRENSVGVHVRRGDFTNTSNRYAHDICDKDYYDKAIKKIREMVDNPMFFVFSDDINYCKNLFEDLDNVVFVSGKRFRVDEEMNLISMCKSVIIANSTFAFWAAWISDHPEKIVVCPRIVFRSNYSWNEFSVPSHWIKIDNI